EAELQRYLPFLATTKILVAAVKAGVGREQAHEAIKEHAVAVALDMRERGSARNDLVDRLVADPRLSLDRSELEGVLDDPLAFTGAAAAQTDAFVATVAEIAERHPHAAAYD